MIHRASALAAACILAASPAAALMQSFTVTLSGNPNVPVVTVQNTGTPGIPRARITQVTISIGDTGFNFDSVGVLSTPAGGTITAVAPSDGNGGLRSDVADVTFTGFDGGETASYDLDVDIDSANSTEDYRTVMFNNGASTPNSIVNVLFGDGLGLGIGFPDDSPNLTSYSVSSSFFTPEGPPTNDVPIPAALPLMATALAGLALVGRRRRSG